jgi:hypothetical protein
VIRFTRNTPGALVRPGLAVMPDTLLDTMLRGCKACDLDAEGRSGRVHSPNWRKRRCN